LNVLEKVIFRGDPISFSPSFPGSTWERGKKITESGESAEWDTDMVNIPLKFPQGAQDRESVTFHNTIFA